MLDIFIEVIHCCLILCSSCLILCIPSTHNIAFENAFGFPNCMFWPPCDLISLSMMSQLCIINTFFVRWCLFMIDPYSHHLFHALRFWNCEIGSKAYLVTYFWAFQALWTMLAMWLISTSIFFFLSSIASMCFTSMSLRCCNNFNMCHWLLCEFHIPFCSLSLPTHQSMSMHYPISQLLDFCLNAFMLLHYLFGCLNLQVF